MPELPEVETVARGVAERITGLRISVVHLYRPEILHGNAGPLDQLIGRRIDDVRRNGKQIRILISGRNDKSERGGDCGLAWFVHLGMTGRLVVTDRSRLVERHTHLQISFHNRRLELRFCDPRRFGGLWLVYPEKGDILNNCGGGAARAAAWKGRRLPPTGADPLTIPLAQMRNLLQRRRQIKALLLDQQPLSGLGNIYCDELLFRAGVHPRTSAADLSSAAVRRLWQAMRRVLNEAIRAGGSSISDYRDAADQPGLFQVRHRVYRRAGQPCRNCGHAIERLIVAGRGTYICPVCQPMRACK